MDWLSKFANGWSVNDWGKLNVLVAVSGGSDSVALLQLLIQARTQLASATGGKLSGQIFVAHFDHQLRDDSADDANWVAALSAELRVPCHIGKAKLGEISSELDARSARYSFLEATAQQNAARYIADRPYGR